MSVRNWSNLAKVVYKRTYARKDYGKIETWNETCERAVAGNLRIVREMFPSLSKEINKESEQLLNMMRARKAGPAGRGYWFSGTDAHKRIGGVALNNCWGLTSEEWTTFVIAMDLLMLGGGVGMTVEHRYTSKLPKVRKDVAIVHKATKDADFIVPDSREGWMELFRRVLESFFSSGASFSYSTVCIRAYGEPIKGFGGTASGAKPLIEFVDKVVGILRAREGKSVRPIDAMDLLCAVGELVVAGNVRRSAILILGDPWDKDYLRAKRWDLGPVPTYRAMANLSVVCDDVEDLHPLFWATYENGEPFGILNRKNMQTYGRMGELKEDKAVVVNPCVPGYTEILTRKGFVPIEHLVDQEVEVWNGFEWSKVTPKITGYNQPMVNVQLSSGQNLVCTEQHKFVIATDYKGTTDRIAAINLEPGMKLIKSNYPVLTEGRSVEYAYTQGFVSAEGMDNYNYIYVYEPKLVCLPRLSFSSKSGTATRTAIKLNFDKHPKSFVPFEWNLKSRLDWFAGLLDGDGTELKEGGSQTTSVDKEFLLEVQKMLMTMGVGSKVTLSRPGGSRPMPDGKGGYKDSYCQPTYRLIVGSVQMQFLKSLGLKCERMSFDKSPQRDASQFVVVTSVDKLEQPEEVVYCFTEPKRNMGVFSGVLTGQCAEATLEPFEPCNLTEQALANIESPAEFIEASRLSFRYAKRVTLEHYHHTPIQKVISRNRRVGVGITGCLESSLFSPEHLDAAYAAIQEENEKYSAQLGVPKSVRTTVIKPSGTMSKVMDQRGEGIHPAYSRYMIQRVRFSSNDPLIPLLKAAGHPMEPVVRFDGTFDSNTLVVDFYLEAPEGMPCADEGFDTWKQLDTLLLAQKHWADQAVSVTVYYKREELQEIKNWLANNLKYIKTISFLCHNDHGFKQAPKEAITKEEYERLSGSVKDLDVDAISGDAAVEDLECAGGVCPIK